MIAIIDYEAGNLGSVRKAFDYLSVPYRVVSSGPELAAETPSAVVLPGVGAFGAAMEKLTARGFVPVLKDFIANDRPFLGICVGMQLLMESSEEAPGVKGLGIIPGTCRRFPEGKVPQIGWNPTRTRPGSGLFKDIPKDSSFYYIHSYYVEENVDKAGPEGAASAAWSEYGIPFVSAFERSNLYGVQFHPEKSSTMGLELLRNWVRTLNKSFCGGQEGRPVTDGIYKFKKSPLAAGGRIKGARVIPCLDVDNGRVVKGVEFKGIRDAGDPVELAIRYDREGADEITFLDIGATYKSRDILLEIVERVSRQIFVPLTVGGGISSLEDMRMVLNTGADKVSVCSAAIRNPSLLSEGAKRFGSQCIVLSIDAGPVGGGFHAFVKGGREDSGLDVLEWAKQGEASGAGEILLNCIHRDGTQEGYDLELTRKVAEAVNIPVIASGGAGTLEHMADGFVKGKADAVLLASLLHDNKMGLANIKSWLHETLTGPGQHVN